MKRRLATKESTWKLWDTVEDMDLSISLSVKILKTIIHSMDEYTTTIKMQEILDSSQSEEEILEKVEAYYQAIKGKN